MDTNNTVERNSDGYPFVLFTRYVYGTGYAEGPYISGPGRNYLIHHGYKQETFQQIDPSLKIPLKQGYESEVEMIRSVPYYHFSLDDDIDCYDPDESRVNPHLIAWITSEEGKKLDSLFEIVYISKEYYNETNSWLIDSSWNTERIEFLPHLLEKNSLKPKVKKLGNEVKKLENEVNIKENEISLLKDELNKLNKEFQAFKKLWYG